MKALLDTNILIHREASKVINQDIGILFRWLDREKYTKCIHSVSINELKKYVDKTVVNTFMTKLNSYEKIIIASPLQKQVENVSDAEDMTCNDHNDTILLNEVYVGRVDILISEDRKIHRKAAILGLQDKVFTIDSFLEKVFSEHPDLIDYKVLNVKKVKFGELNLKDPFFDSLKEDYPGFQNWFIKKFDDECYITFDSRNGLLLSFLYLKVEDVGDNYSDITPHFQPKKRLKIGTFKVINNGVRLGERFLKIIFDNALKNRVDEIYVTAYDKRAEQKRLILLLEQWGFGYWGRKGNESVFVRNFSPSFDINHIAQSYPYLALNQNIFIVPIYPSYHTELFPDSILKTESPAEFVEDFPHRNCISKIYVSRALPPYPRQGDILIFYRTGGYYKSVVSTIGVVLELKNDFSTEEDFLQYCKKATVFPLADLHAMWNYSTQKPFTVKFLYTYSFPIRINMKRLIELHILRGVNDAPRGFYPITKEQLKTILRETKSDESFIVD